MIRQRTPGQVEHLEGPHESLPVAGLNTMTRFRVYTRDHPVEQFDASPVGNPLQPAPQGLVTARSGEQPSREGPVVKASAAHENGQTTPCLNSCDEGCAFARVSGRRVLFKWIGDIHHVMGDSLLLVSRHLVSANVKAPIHRRRVTTDDFPAVPYSKMQRETALA
jgi:hypothetical protein